MTTVAIAALPPLPDTAVNQESPITDNEDTEKRFEHVSKEESGPNIDQISEELDPNLITWHGPDDPDNPKNWSQGNKWFTTLLMSCICLSTLSSSTMIAASLGVIARDLHIESRAVAQLSLSAFVLSYAFAPMFFGPLSEIFGRVRVLQYSNLFFLLWTVIGGFSESDAVLIVARLFAGLGGGAIYAIGSGFLSDCWSPAERGKSFAIYSSVPLLGPAIGPLLGGIMTNAIGWRWIFWVMAIFDAIILLLAVLFIRETHARTILYRRMLKIAKATGNTNLHTKWDAMSNNAKKRNPGKVLAVTSTRAFRMLATEPILQIIAIYQAYIYGIMFLALSTFATIWTTRYNETTAQSGLHYISVVAGSATGTLIGGPLNDRIWAYLSKKHQRENGTGVPEYRVPLMIPGAILVPAGLLWYGWSAQSHLFWLMPDVGMAIFFFGITSGGQCMSAYVIDTYVDRAASATAAVTFLRSIMGFAFPLFAPKLYEAIGLGWGNTLLALLVVVIGWPIPVILWVYGARLRARSSCNKPTD